MERHRTEQNEPKEEGNFGRLASVVQNDLSSEGLPRLCGKTHLVTKRNRLAGS